MVRLLRNLLVPDFTTAIRFPKDRRDRLVAGVRGAEQGHYGEIQIYVEGSLPLIDVLCGKTPRARAEEIFAANRLWDTERNTGVLIYLLLSERELEIVADRGIPISKEGWKTMAELFAAHAKRGDYEGAFATLLARLRDTLIAAVPIREGAPDRDELSNEFGG